MDDTVDLQAYFRRIGRPAAEVADLVALRELVTAHVAAIPFENLNPFLGLPVELELAAVQHKLVHEGRGGYCFEQNLLLGEVLRAIGFEVTNLAARVLWGQKKNATTARTHMLLRVMVAGQPHLVDVGFGGPTPTDALAWTPDVEQPTPNETFRLLERDDEWFLQCKISGDWKTLYRFDLQPQYPIDYRATNYFLSTHPESRFVTTLGASRATPGRRLALHNRDFVVHDRTEGTRRRTLRHGAEIRAVLENDFLIRLPAHPELDARLDGLPD